MIFECYTRGSHLIEADNADEARKREIDAQICESHGDASRIEYAGQGCKRVADAIRNQGESK